MSGGRNSGDCAAGDTDRAVLSCDLFLLCPEFLPAAYPVYPLTVIPPVSASVPETGGNAGKKENHHGGERHAFHRRKPLFNAAASSRTGVGYKRVGMPHGIHRFYPAGEKTVLRNGRGGKRNAGGKRAARNGMQKGLDTGGGV